MAHEDLMDVWDDPRGFVGLRWAPGLDIDAELADAAVRLIDARNGDRKRPLLVIMTGTRSLSRDGRIVFTRPCQVSRLALLGRSRVDSIIANFALGVAGHPMPMRFFTEEAEAAAWLVATDVPSSGFRWRRTSDTARPMR